MIAVKRYMLFILTALVTIVGICQGQEEWRVPDPPENVRCKTNRNSATLWWDPPSSLNEILVRGYTISYGIGTPGQKIIIEGANTNAFTISRLKPNTTYVFVLTAYNEAEGEDSEKVYLTATTETFKNSNELPFRLHSPTNIVINTISPTRIQVSWSDPNGDYELENFVYSSGIHKKIYLIQYGIHQSAETEKISSHSRNLIINGLRPGTEYEIAVKVVMSDGMESPWSIRELFTTPIRPTEKPRIDWPKVFDVRCNFEHPDTCGFESQQGAPLEWTRIQSGYDQRFPRTINGNYYMVLHSSAIPEENYGRLVSKPFHYKEGSYICISIRIYVKRDSYGILIISILTKHDKDPIFGRILFVGDLERIRNDYWQTILLNINAPRNEFQLVFEVRKKDRNYFWIGLDDVDILSGRCPNETNSVPRNVAQFNASKNNKAKFW